MKQIGLTTMLALTNHFNDMTTYQQPIVHQHAAPRLPTPGKQQKLARLKRQQSRRK